MGQLKVKFVWGQRFSPTGQYVEAWVGNMLCARFKAWHGKVEANTITLYPCEVRRVGYINTGKQTLALRDICNA